MRTGRDCLTVRFQNCSLDVHCERTSIFKHWAALTIPQTRVLETHQNVLGDRRPFKGQKLKILLPTVLPNIHRLKWLILEISTLPGTMREKMPLNRSLFRVMAPFGARRLVCNFETRTVVAPGVPANSGD
jgi:hypothetical protein